MPSEVTMSQSSPSTITPFQKNLCMSDVCTFCTFVAFLHIYLALTAVCTYNVIMSTRNPANYTLSCNDIIPEYWCGGQFSLQIIRGVLFE